MTLNEIINLLEDSNEEWVISRGKNRRLFHINTGIVINLYTQSNVISIDLSVDHHISLAIAVSNWKRHNGQVRHKQEKKKPKLG